MWASAGIGRGKCMSNISIYICKDGRTRVYFKDTHKVISYPRYLIENKIGRKLLPNEDIHHKDGNPLNNDMSNLEIKLHGEHQKEHSQKYFDKKMICPICNKEFNWTAKQQSDFFGNKNRHIHQSDKPFCSKTCSGKYGKSISMLSW